MLTIFGIVGAVIALPALVVIAVTVRRERRWTTAGATPARELVRSTR
jgi:predicted PurR-regulated permease PerM